MTVIRHTDTETDWMRRSACRDADPELFFPLSGQHGDEARAYCRKCVVEIPCLLYALRYPRKTQAGIWGNTSAEERAQLRTQFRTWDRQVAS